MAVDEGWMVERLWIGNGLQERWTGNLGDEQQDLQAEKLWIRVGNGLYPIRLWDGCSHSSNLPPEITGFSMISPFLSPSPVQCWRSVR